MYGGVDRFKPFVRTLDIRIAHVKSLMLSKAKWPLSSAMRSKQINVLTLMLFRVLSIFNCPIMQLTTIQVKRIPNLRQSRMPMLKSNMEYVN